MLSNPFASRFTNHQTEKGTTDMQEITSVEAAGAVAEQDAGIRILKVADCPSLSARSKLTYEIGCKFADAEGVRTSDPEILFRVTTNSGKGFFSDAWINAEQIAKVFEKKGGTSITSSTLSCLFRGKSTNSSGFLLAILKAEGLVVAVENKRRYYEQSQSDVFAEEFKSLMADAIPLEVADAAGDETQTARKHQNKRKEKLKIATPV
jgi:hypothetical protein